MSTGPEQRERLGRGGTAGGGGGSPLMATRQHLAYTPATSSAISSTASQQQQQQQRRGYTNASTPHSTPISHNQTHTRTAAGGGPSSTPYIPGSYSSNYHHHQYQPTPTPTINTINKSNQRRIPGTSTPMGRLGSNGNGSGRGSGVRKVFGHPL